MAVGQRVWRGEFGEKGALRGSRKSRSTSPSRSTAALTEERDFMVSESSSRAILPSRPLTATHPPSTRYTHGATNTSICIQNYFAINRAWRSDNGSRKSQTPFASGQCRISQRDASLESGETSKLALQTLDPEYMPRHKNFLAI